jgi:RNA polymerase sigma factor (sigma-70 family)
MRDSHDTHLLSDHLFRQCAGKMVASLMKKYGYDHIDLVTDAVQDTFETALKTWRFNIPSDPQAWLYKVVHNKTINALKALQRRHTNTKLEVYAIDDEQLHIEDTEAEINLLLFCCNEELSLKNQIIVTLSIVGGLGVHEIANALNMEYEAVKKSIYRSKQILKNSHIPEQYKSTTTLFPHMEKIMQMLYLIFNEGYKTTRHPSGINKDLCYEALRLALLLYKKCSDHHALKALMALMFFDIARFPARLADNDQWIALEDHDRSLYDPTLIEEGYHYLDLAQQSGQVSTYYTEALISSIHCTAPNFEETNWPQLLDLYKVLSHMKPDDHRIKLNVALVSCHIKPSIDLIDDLTSLENQYQLQDDYTYIVTKAYILGKCGSHDEALQAYHTAMTLTSHTMDIALIKDRISLLNLSNTHNT